MTDYQYVWGPVQKQWKLIDYRASHLYFTLMVSAWMGMIGFFIFGGFVILTKADSAVIAMLISLAVWLGSGIAILKIRHGRSKFLTIQQ